MKLKATESSKRTEGVDFTQDHTHTHRCAEIYSRWTDKVVNPRATLT